MLVLIVVRGPAKGQVIQLPDDTDRWVIGRKRQPGSRMVWLQDTRISRHHGDLMYRDGMWYIRDVGSSNGTFINQQPLRPGDGWRALHDGDQIAMGRTVMVAGYVEGMQRSSAAPAQTSQPQTAGQTHDDANDRNAGVARSASKPQQATIDQHDASDAGHEDEAAVFDENGESIIGVPFVLNEDELVDDAEVQRLRLTDEPQIREALGPSPLPSPEERGGMTQTAPGDDASPDDEVVHAGAAADSVVDAVDHAVAAADSAIDAVDKLLAEVLHDEAADDADDPDDGGSDGPAAKHASSEPDASDIADAADQPEPSDGDDSASAIADTSGPLSAPTWRDLLEDQPVPQKRPALAWKVAAALVLGAGACFAFYLVSNTTGPTDRTVTTGAQRPNDRADTTALATPITPQPESAPAEPPHSSRDLPGVNQPPQPPAPPEQAEKPADRVVTRNGTEPPLPSGGPSEPTPLTDTPGTSSSDVAPDLAERELDRPPAAERLASAMLPDIIPPVEALQEPPTSGVIPTEPAGEPAGSLTSADAPNTADTNSVDADAAAVPENTDVDFTPATPRAPAPITAARTIVFVVDASGSQVDTLPLALRHLEETVGFLTPDQRFTILFFQGDRVIEVAPDGLKAADERTKLRVADWIAPGASRILPMGASNAAAALRRAVEYKPDQLFIYSDRLVSARASDEQHRELLTLLDELNSDRTIQINTVQLIYDDPRHTLRTIATEHHGHHTFIAPRRPAEPPPAAMDLLR